MSRPRQTRGRERIATLVSGEIKVAFIRIVHESRGRSSPVWVARLGLSLDDVCGNGPTGASVALQVPQVNTDPMIVPLRLSLEGSDGSDHAVLIMDQVGWHKA